MESELALVISYYLGLRGHHFMALSMLLSLDCHLPIQDIGRLCFEYVLWRRTTSVLSLECYTSGLNQAVEVLSNLFNHFPLYWEMGLYKSDYLYDFQELSFRE